MLYREIGQTGKKVSSLGFGLMRLPVINNETSQIDEAKAISMVRKAIDKGVNYLDTAWTYHDGASEPFCRKVMEEGYRDKVFVATKMPSWEPRTHEDLYRILDKQLENLGTDHIDFYLLHTLKTTFWETYKKLDYKTFLKRSRGSGKIHHYGFSYHDNIELFKEIVDDFDWEFVQIQLNYLDESYQAGLEGMRYAASKGMGVIVMEPLRGGMLAMADMPEDFQKILDKAPEKRSAAQWAFRYLWNLPEVSTVLSGMSTMEQLDENLQTASDSAAESMSEEEKATLMDMQQFFRERLRVNCTNCRYCMPCSSGVNIPELFWAYNHDALFKDTGKAKFWVNGFLNPEQKASACTECGVCIDKCPQGIAIPEHMKKITALYEQD